MVFQVFSMAERGRTSRYGQLTSLEMSIFTHTSTNKKQSAMIETSKENTTETRAKRQGRLPQRPKRSSKENDAFAKEAKLVYRKRAEKRISGIFTTMKSTDSSLEMTPSFPHNQTASFPPDKMDAHCLGPTVNGLVVCIAFVFHIPVDFQIPVSYVSV